jgi:hypothetical protein
MAENKKSFLLYTDLIHTVSKMPKDKVADLFLTILDYVNDLNPEPGDLVVQVAFEPIKQQLKRDLRKWDKYVQKQQNNGLKGGRPKTQKTQAFSEEPKKADNVTVNVNDNVSVIDFKAPTHTDVKMYFYQQRPNGWSDARCTVEATNFCDHYESVGWVTGTGLHIKNWQALVRKWISNDKGGDSFQTPVKKMVI